MAISKVWLTSDTHFSHSNILGFKREDGSPLRPGFANADEMDECIIERWNSVVKPEDKVYHLGDVAFKDGLKLVAKLNGTKVLIKGNHDQAKLSAYAKLFKDVRGTHKLDNLLLSHVPIHPSQIARFKMCVHGHLHDKEVLCHSGRVDGRYYSVCVERHNYYPVALEQVIAEAFKRKGAWEQLQEQLAHGVFP